MNKSFINVILIYIGLLLISFFSYGAEFVVIVAQDAPTQTIKIEQLKRIYLGKELINPQGKRWVPINLSLENPLRIEFTQQLFQKKPEEMESYWNKQYFKGISPPYVVASEEAMIRFIVNTPEAIGYISRCNIDDRSRIVFDPTPSNQSPSDCNIRKSLQN